MNWKLFVPAILCTFATGIVHGATPQGNTEQRCGIMSKEPAQMVFAKVDDQQPWKKYKRVEDIAELSLGFGISAEAWTGRNHALLIRTVEPGEDFTAYTEYCFDPGGHLVHLAYELRTAWGWGFRTGCPVMGGSIHTDSKEFFSTENEKPTPKPEAANDVRDALKPSMYLTLDRLPFSKLLLGKRPN